MYLGHVLDLSRSLDVIGHVTIRFPHPTSYMCSIGTDTLSPRDYLAVNLSARPHF